MEDKYVKQVGDDLYDFLLKQDPDLLAEWIACKDLGGDSFVWEIYNLASQSQAVTGYDDQSYFHNAKKAEKMVLFEGGLTHLNHILDDENEDLVEKGFNLLTAERWEALDVLIRQLVLGTTNVIWYTVGRLQAKVYKNNPILHPNRRKNKITIGLIIGAIVVALTEWIHPGYGEWAYFICTQILLCFIIKSDWKKMKEEDKWATVILEILAFYIMFNY